MENLRLERRPEARADAQGKVVEDDSNKDMEAAAAPNLTAAYAKASAAMVENLLNPDTVEGISAFLAKRPPAWA